MSSHDLPPAAARKIDLAHRLSGLVPAQAVPSMTASASWLAEGALREPLFAMRATCDPVAGPGELFWADPDMSDLCADATGSLEALHWGAVQLPAPRGTLVLAKPLEMTVLVGRDVDDGVLEVPTRAIYWEEFGDGLVVTSLVDAPGGQVEWFGVAFAPRHDKVTFMFGRQPPQVLAAFALLASQPGIAVSSEHRAPAPPPIKKGRRRVAARKPPPVRVVTLRPGSPTAEAYDESAGRNVQWRHRWLVRGHWRQAPYPSLGEGVTKPIWIAPYLKGPAGAPLLTSPKVTAVRLD